MENNKNLRYLVMPDFVYEDEKLTDVSRRVYCFIHTFKGEYFFFGNEHLSQMFHCSEWSISQAISQLIELEYILCEYRQKSGGGKTRFVKDLKGLLQLGEKPNLKIGSTQSGDKKSEATTIAKPNDNDINDNNLMGNFFEKDKEPELKEDFTLLMEKYNKKEKTVGKPWGIPQKYSERPRKRGVFAENIV